MASTVGTETRKGAGVSEIIYNDVNFGLDSNIAEIINQHRMPVLGSDKYSYAKKDDMARTVIIVTDPDLTAGEITTLIAWGDAKGYDPTDES